MEGCNERRDGYRKRSLAINKENPPAGRLRTAGRVYFFGGKMSFEEIPEDQVEGYPCECGGSITLQDGIWECNLCEFKKLDQRGGGNGKNKNIHSKARCRFSSMCGKKSKISRRRYYIKYNLCEFKKPER